MRLRTVALSTVTSAGLTTSVTAYTSGDQVGTEIDMGFAVPIKQVITIVGLVVVDAGNVLVDHDLYFFNAATTPAADNAAASWSDADMAKICTVVNLTADNASALNKTITWEGRKPFVLDSGNALKVNIVTRSGNSFFVAATDVTIRAFVEMGE